MAGRDLTLPPRREGLGRAAVVVFLEAVLLDLAEVFFLLVFLVAGFEADFFFETALVVFFLAGAFFATFFLPVDFAAVFFFEDVFLDAVFLVDVFRAVDFLRLAAFAVTFLVFFLVADFFFAGISSASKARQETGDYTYTAMGGKCLFTGFLRDQAPGGLPDACA